MSRFDDSLPMVGATYRVELEDCCMKVQFVARLELALGYGKTFDDGDPAIDPFDDSEWPGWPEYRTYWSNGIVLDGNPDMELVEA